MQIEKRKRETFVTQLNRLDSQLYNYLANPTLYGITDTDTLTALKTEIEAHLHHFHYLPEKKQLEFLNMKNFAISAMSTLGLVMFEMMRKASWEEFVPLFAIICTLSAVLQLISTHSNEEKVDYVYDHAMHQGVDAMELIQRVEQFIRDNTNNGSRAALANQVSNETSNPRSLRIER